MNIHQNGGLVGSLSATDSNAQSFKPPNRQRPGGRKHLLLDGSDVLTIETQAAYRSENNSATAQLWIAIAFNQTQDAFLQKVQEALRRMNELTALAQTATAPETDQAAYASEFTQLQDAIEDLGKSMFKTVNRFQTSNPERVGNSVQLETRGTLLMTENSIQDLIEITAIGAAARASEAGGHINRALKAVAEMRAEVGSNLEHLCLTGEEMFASNASLSDAERLIEDINVAEASTKFARFDMLNQSGTAMLAQANALPESALRLLN